MSKRRIIFLTIFGAYELGIFVFSVIVESNKTDMGFLFDVFGKIHLVKYGTFFGVALLAVEFIWTWMDGRKSAKEKEAMRNENNELKAKVDGLTHGTTTPVK
jgi:hypothetical protein